MRKYSFILFVFLSIPFLSHSQKTSEIKGIIADPYNIPIENAVVKIVETNDSVKTDKAGSFMFSNIPYGDYNISISAEQYNAFTLPVKADQKNIDLRNIAIQREGNESTDDNIPVISLADADLQESSAESASSVLNASRDPFISAVSYTFSKARFRARGYEFGNEVTMMNGALMNDLNDDRSEYFTWSGLNDVTRSRESSYGLEANEFAFGAVGGASMIDSRASKQRKQLQVSYAIGNRSFDNRVMLTYGSGVTAGGWSYAVSGTRRWANEGYIKGTFYDSWSYFATVEKIINLNHSVNLAVFASPTKIGRAAATFREFYDIAGTHYYNSNWGYQDGKIRNSKVTDNHQPAIVLTHDWKIDERSNLTTAASYLFGKSKYSGIDWYNARDPRPDYYRNLPSFNPDPAVAALATYYLETHKDLLQVDWLSFYEANTDSVFTLGDINQQNNNNIVGFRANYILYNKISDVKKANINAVYNNSLSDNTAVTLGVNAQNQQTEFYKEMKDLLGADFYVDLNQYAEQTSPTAIQNDLNNPNALIKVNDKYNYDYFSNVRNLGGWGQIQVKTRKIDYFFATSVSTTQYQRDGKFLNGVFSDNSFGKSPRYTYVNIGEKGGLTYKYNGRNFVYINAGYFTNAPDFDDAFIAPTVRADVADHLTNEKIISVEGGYLLKSPKYKARATAYFTRFNDGIRTYHFYYDELHTFVNYTVTGINKRSGGLELAAEANIMYGISVSAAASIGQYVFTSRPRSTITQDNLDTVLARDVVSYTKGFHVGLSPEKAYTLGLNYRAKQFWNVNVNLNYYDGLWVEPNPVKRTETSLDLIENDSQLWHDLVTQEKTDGQFTIDIRGGKSWKLNNYITSLKRNMFIVLNAGIDNVLNNKDLIISGYENLRTDANGELSNPNKFPAKYAYAFGTTYYLNLVLRFN